MFFVSHSLSQCSSEQDHYARRGHHHHQQQHYQIHNANRNTHAHSHIGHNYQSPNTTYNQMYNSQFPHGLSRSDHEFEHPVDIDNGLDLRPESRGIYTPPIVPIIHMPTYRGYTFTTPPPYTPKLCASPPVPALKKSSSIAHMQTPFIESQLSTKGEHCPSPPLPALRKQGAVQWSSHSPPIPTLRNKHSTVNPDNNNDITNEESASSSLSRSSSPPIPTLRQKNINNLSSTFLEALCHNCRSKTEVMLSTSTNFRHLPSPPIIKQQSEYPLRKKRVKKPSPFPFPLRSPLFKVLLSDGCEAVVRDYFPVTEPQISSDQVLNELTASDVSSSQDDNSVCTVVPSKTIMQVEHEKQQTQCNAEQNTLVKATDGHPEDSDKTELVTSHPEEIFPCALAPSPVQREPKVEVEILRKSNLTPTVEQKNNAKVPANFDIQESNRTEKSLTDEQDGMTTKIDDDGQRNDIDVFIRRRLCFPVSEEEFSCSDGGEEKEEEIGKKSYNVPHPPSPSVHPPSQSQRHNQLKCSKIKDGSKESCVKKTMTNQQSCSSIASCGSTRSSNVNILSRAVKFHLLTSLLSLNDAEDKDDEMMKGLYPHYYRQTSSPPIRTVQSLPSSMTKSISEPSFTRKITPTSSIPPAPPTRSNTLPTFGNQIVTDLATLRQMYPRQPRKSDHCQYSINKSNIANRIETIYAVESEQVSQAKRIVDRKEGSATKNVLFRLGSDSSCSVASEASSHPDKIQNSNNSSSYTNVDNLVKRKNATVQLFANTSTEQNKCAKQEEQAIKNIQISEEKDRKVTEYKEPLEQEEKFFNRNVDKESIVKGLNRNKVKESEEQQKVSQIKDKDEETSCDSDNDLASDDDESYISMSSSMSLSVSLSTCDSDEHTLKEHDSHEEDNSFIDNFPLERKPTPYCFDIYEEEEEEEEAEVENTVSVDPIGLSTDTYTIGKSCDTYTVGKSNDTYVIHKSTDTYTVHRDFTNQK